MYCTRTLLRTILLCNFQELHQLDAFCITVADVCSSLVQGHPKQLPLSSKASIQHSIFLENPFHCTSGFPSIVDRKLFCNGQPDCWDKSDEIEQALSQNSVGEVMTRCGALS